MGTELGEGKRLVEAATDPDPEVGIAAVVALRGLVEVLEALQVDNARAQGWSWRDIARRLGGTKQTGHYKHAPRARGRGKACGIDWPPRRGRGMGRARGGPESRATGPNATKSV